MKLGIHWLVLAFLASVCLGSTPNVSSGRTTTSGTYTSTTSAWSSTTPYPTSTDTTTQNTASSSTDDSTTSTTTASSTSTPTTTPQPTSTLSVTATSPAIYQTPLSSPQILPTNTTSPPAPSAITTMAPAATTQVLPPIFNNMSLVVPLYVGQNQNKVLEYINCTDPNNQQVIVSLDSVSPTTGACYRCFTIIPCPPVWCLNFISTIGTLDIRNTPIYYLTISCSNLISETKRPLQVRLTTNSPPVFLNGSFASHKVYNTKSLGSGAVIYTVKANDSDGDTLRYFMPSTPDTGNFQIGESDGIISATNNLSRECRSSVTFQVYVSDGINKQVGPMIISVTFYDINRAPSITNLDATIQVPEDKPKGASIYKIVTDDEDTATVTYTLTSPNSQAMFLFNVTGHDILLVSMLDFENPIAGGNRIVLSVSAKDKEGCSSGMKTLYVYVTDVNEAPTLEPSSLTERVNEGFISLKPPWRADDPEGNPTRYSINGSQSQFSIDSVTGEIKSIGDYDVDTNKKYTVNLTIQLTDTGGLFDQSILTINIVDINDNRPVISPATLALSVPDCTNVGETIAKQGFKATDADSIYQGNSVTYFISQPSKFFTVWSNGDIVLTAPIRSGEYSTATVVASDQGQYPGPLQSSPAFVTVRGIPCPTTTIKTTPTTITTTMTTQVTTQNSTALPLSPRDTWSENLPWITTSALLGTCLLGLLAFMGCRYLKKPSCTRFSSPKKRKPTKPIKIKPAPEQANYSKPEINIHKPEGTIPQKMPTVNTESNVTGPQDAQLFDFWTTGLSFR